MLIYGLLVFFLLLAGYYRYKWDQAVRVTAFVLWQVDSHSHQLQQCSDALVCMKDDMQRALDIGEAWKTYALGYEVFCEATYDKDEVGVLNAGTVIATARTQLQSLGEYDA